MPFVQALRRRLPAIQRRHEVSREANQRLDREKDVRDQPQDAVRGFEMMGPSSNFVIFDDDESCNQEIEGEVIEREMRDGASALLGRSVCRLEDENGLCEEEETGGVEEWMGGEEDQIMEEDARPD